MNKKTLLSGVKPTGRPHIGNYFGAMRQFVDLQNKHTDAHKLFMIADYHGLNFIQDASVMRQNILDLALDYLAIGLDPKQSIIFKQSDVSAHTELAWIFDSITNVTYLMQAHAFKARVDEVFFKNNPNFLTESLNDNEKGYDTFKDMINRVFKGINVGDFNYPMLMASDILLYDVDIVPIGQDQKQHIEYARDTAQKFNGIFGETFKLPEHMIMEKVAIVPGTDGQKMSKSYGNTIPLFASREEITKAVMSIVTDSSGDVPVNVYNIHKLLKSESELKNLYDSNKGKYKILKEALIDDLDTFIKPMRERRAELAKDMNAVKNMLKDGAEKARAKADKKLAEVKEKIGVNS